MKREVVVFLFGLIFTCSFVSAVTIDADSCSQTDVQLAIDSASDGDTVIIPPG